MLAGGGGRRARQGGLGHESVAGRGDGGSTMI
jgi:hypothetical protein